MFSYILDPHNPSFPHSLAIHTFLHFKTYLYINLLKPTGYVMHQQV